MRFVSVNTVLEDWLAFSGEETEVPERLIKRYANDAADAILEADQWQHRMSLLDINNYTHPLPNGFMQVVQAAAYTDSLPSERGEIKEQIVEWTQDMLDGSGCKLDIKVDCPECENPDKDTLAVVDVNRIYEQSHPELYTSYMNHFYRVGGNTREGRDRSVYHPRFRLMRASTNNFFNADYYIPGCLNIDFDTELEYRIDPPKIVCNFSEGMVLFSYLSKRVDEDGYMLIPDEPIAFEAVNRFIEERLAYRDYRREKTQMSRRFWHDTVQAKRLAIMQARDEINMPDPDEVMTIIDNHWRRVIPNYNWQKNNNRFNPDQYNQPRF